MLRTGPSLGLSPGTRKAGVPRKNERGEINMKQLLKKLVTEDSGQDLIEYALVAALVGLGAVASITALKNSISNTFNSIGSQLASSTA
jgi:pilus assembly protein Flp/PilA